MTQITATDEAAAPARAGWKDTLKRAGRVAVATAIGGILEHYRDDPVMLAATPVLAAVGKKLRDRFPRLRAWLPF